MEGPRCRNESPCEDINKPKAIMKMAQKIIQPKWEKGPRQPRAGAIKIYRIVISALDGLEFESANSQASS